MTGKRQTVVLYRPVGSKELELVRRSGFRAFPPRLPHQPTFYPVTTREYATHIAREWNAKDPAQDYRGFVTRFHVDADFIAKYTPHVVGSTTHEEYWIPAADLAEFNRHIVGLIEVIAEYPGGPDAA